MSAIDDLIARDAAASAPAGVDALIARDASMSPQQTPQVVQAAAAAPAMPTPALTPANPQAPENTPANGLTPDQQAEVYANGGMVPQPGAFTDMVKGGAHGIGSMVNNIADVVEKGGAAAINAIPGVRGTSFGNAVNNVANSDVAAQAADDQQFAQNAPTSQKAMAIVAPMVLPVGDLAAGVKGAAQALPMMGGAAGRVIGGALGNAAAGAAAGAGAPIDPSKPYWSQVGTNAGVGAALNTAAPALYGLGKGIVGSVGNVLKPVIAPRNYVGQGLASALGDAAPDVATNIRTAPQFVPGSLPTTAQAGANPMLVATEKAAANANPDFKLALAQRGIDNNDARWQTLMGVAKDPQALEAAADARDQAATPLYNAAHQQTANVGPAFMRYAQIPEMQEAMQRANSLASLDAAVGRGVPPVWPTPQSKAINGAALDYTSRALGDMIDEAQRSGATSKAAALTALKSNVDNWTQSYIPGVQQAKAVYAAGSVPVNTMHAGQQIAGSLGTRSMNPGGAPEIQLNNYRTALGQALKGQEYGIDPDALNSLQGIGQDLQRATISNGLKSPGSDTAYNLNATGWLAKQLYGPTFAGSTNLGRAIAGLGTAAAGHPWAGIGVASAMGKVGQTVGGRLNDQLSDLLLNPSGLLPYLDARGATAINPTQKALGAALQRNVLPAVVGGTVRNQLIQSGN